MKYKNIWGVVLALGLGNLFGAAESKSNDPDAHTEITEIRKTGDFGRLKIFLRDHPGFDYESEYKDAFNAFLADPKPTTAEGLAAEKDKMIKFGQQILRGTGTYIALAEILFSLRNEQFEELAKERSSDFFNTPLGISLVLGRALGYFDKPYTPTYIGKYFSFAKYFECLAGKIAGAEGEFLGDFLDIAARKLESEKDRWAFYHHMVPLESVIAQWRKRNSSAPVVAALLNEQVAKQSAIDTEEAKQLAQDKLSVQDKLDFCLERYIAGANRNYVLVKVNTSQKADADRYEIRLDLGGLRESIGSALTLLQSSSTRRSFEKAIKRLEQSLLEADRAIIFAGHDLETPEKKVYRLTIPLGRLFAGEREPETYSAAGAEAIVEIKPGKKDASISVRFSSDAASGSSYKLGVVGVPFKKPFKIDQHDGPGKIEGGTCETRESDKAEALMFEIQDLCYRLAHPQGYQDKLKKLAENPTFVENRGAIYELIRHVNASFSGNESLSSLVSDDLLRNLEYYFYNPPSLSWCRSVMSRSPWERAKTVWEKSFMHASGTRFNNSNTDARVVYKDGKEPRLIFREFKDGQTWQAGNGAWKDADKKQREEGLPIINSLATRDWKLGEIRELGLE